MCDDRVRSLLKQAGRKFVKELTRALAIQLIESAVNIVQYTEESLPDEPGDVKRRIVDDDLNTKFAKVSRQSHREFARQLAVIAVTEGKVKV